MTQQDRFDGNGRKLPIFDSDGDFSVLKDGEEIEFIGDSGREAWIRVHQSAVAMDVTNYR